MEKMQVDSSELVFVHNQFLDDERIRISSTCRVDKQQLIEKSQYFSALFSGKYKDSDITEFPINLNWSYKNLQAFTFWINENKEYDEPYYTDFKARFKEDLISDLMELIDIANYFAVDQLVKDLKKIIIEYHLNPKKALFLWLHVRNQPMMRDLRDLSFLICVEWFDKLPRNELLELSYEDFIELVGNVNLQCDKEYLEKIMLDWHTLNTSKFGIYLDNFYQIMCLILRDKVYQDNDVVNCGVKYKMDDGQCLILYIWNGISVTEKIVNLPFENEKKLNGTRILFRGFDMYLIGGQFEYKEFNTDIWRYSFITEQWYYVTRMPQALRHMIVVFWKTRLYLIGGTGRYRLKFENQIYYDLETGEWSEPAPIQGFFTDHSLACTIRNKIFVLRSLPFFFYPETRKWERLSADEDHELPMTGVKSVQSYEDTVVFLANDSNVTEIWTMNYEDKDYKMIEYKRIESSVPMSALVISKNDIVGFHETDDQIIISMSFFSPDNKIKSRYHYVHNILNHTLSSNILLGFFNLLNPESLYKKKPALLNLL